MLPSLSDELLLKSCDKTTVYRVTRETLKEISDELEIPDTMVIHLAVARLAKDVLPAYEADNGRLTPSYLAWLRQDAPAALPKGKVLSRKSLL